MSELLFIGNGFDLDLGLKTRYSDFALSEFWPFRLERPNLPSLAAYLNRKKELATWLDLECELGNYAGMNTTLPSPLPGDENAYKCLTERLAAYLAEAQTGPISNDSCAARVLKTYLTDLQESEDSFGDEAVYSFNYTDLHAIAGRLGLDTGFGCRHIHGSLKDGDIVLGFGDGIDCGEGCEYMRKSFNPRYNPPQMLPEMMAADRICFFGLSFGDVDYAYFDAFFTKMCETDVNGKPAVSADIAIFTYDEASRRRLLHNLHRRTGRRWSQLNTLHKVRIFRTSVPGDARAIEEYLSLGARERAAWKRHMEELERMDAESLAEEEIV